MNCSPTANVNTTISAQTGANINAPVLSDSKIGSINVNNYSAEAQKHAEEEKKRENWNSFLENYKSYIESYIKNEAECIFEGNKEEPKSVYTELFITEGDMEDFNLEQILNIGDAPENKEKQKPESEYDQMFKMLKKREKNIVLTKGIAGIGKTSFVQKFILDWAVGNANKDIDCVFLLPFKEIKRIKENINLHEFLQRFYAELKNLEKAVLYEHKLAFIFDGLDESFLPLNFESEILQSVEEKSSVDVLFTNLVKGTLLPSALVWVTSRPAAANKIPPRYVGLFTEVRGFTDEQKEKYFRNRIPKETQASWIISHIKKSRSLYIMCNIPLFCWIVATVLKDISNEEKIRPTITEMYIHFLLIQMKIKTQKYDGKEERECEKNLDSNKTMISKLAKLAFEQLKKKNIVFFEKDLKACGIDVIKEIEYTGIITEYFKKINGLHEKKLFCFVHLSVQEFLAAVHVFICYLEKNTQELQFFFDKPKENITIQELLQKAVDKAIDSQREHLDLFLRFLMGITLESSQNLLQGLITHTEDTTESIRQTAQYIKQVLDKDISDTASVNLFYCLLELKDCSLYEEIMRDFSSDEHPGKKLSSSMCTLLTTVLLMSEKVLDEFNPKRFVSKQSDYKRLIPAMRFCRKALFDGCGLDETCCKTICSVLQSSNSHLTELDLSNNDLHDSGVKLLCDGLNKDCKLEILRLSGCMVTKEGCDYISSALSQTLHLRELDLSYNHPGDSGVKDDPLKPNLDHGGESRITPGLRIYHHQFTLDLNTVNNYLHLSENNREITNTGIYQPYPDHPDRFDYWYQVLCRESVCGRCYWEIEWSGDDGVCISVSYKSISRKGQGDECLFGCNDHSWSLSCSPSSYSFWHHNIKTDLPVESISSRIGVYDDDDVSRIGVFVDHSAGTLSFYSVYRNTMSLIHTVQTTFTQTLYPGFGFGTGSSVKLC